MKPNICPTCQGAMQQNQDAVEWLKCSSCGYGDKKVNFGRACGNCVCIKGQPCAKKAAAEVMQAHAGTLRRLGDS